MKYTVRAGESQFEVEVDRDGQIRLDGAFIETNLQRCDSTLYSLLLGTQSYELRIEPVDGAHRVQVRGVTYEVAVEDDRTRLLAGLKAALGSDSGDIVIKSPMPGVVIDIPVKEGDAVAPGQTLVVIESMKMHNEFKAPRAGTVHAVRVERGAKVAQNTILVTLT